MSYTNTTELKNFLEACKAKLMCNENRKSVDFPEEFITPCWDSKKISESNKLLLDELGNNANVYAIFVANKDSEEYILKYIGQTRKK
ncbi:MAG: hypothetical protein HOP02_11225 [Methylococcaceae bacterium]|nr:hypothetical protein [Methylococcaceae bacterium]